MYAAPITPERAALRHGPPCPGSAPWSMTIECAAAPTPTLPSAVMLGLSDRSCCNGAPFLRLADRLPQIRVDHVKQLLGGRRLLRCRPLVRIQEVRSHVPLDDLRHQPIHGAPAGGDRLEHRPAGILLLADRTLDRVDLAANASQSIQELPLVPYQVSHRLPPGCRPQEIVYPPIVSPSQTQSARRDPRPPAPVPALAGLNDREPLRDSRGGSQALIVPIRGGWATSRRARSAG